MSATAGGRRPRARGLATPRALPPLAALLALYLVAPFAAGFAQVGLADWRGIDLPGLWNASLVSVASATLATALVAFGGIPLGYLLARVPGRAMRLLGFAVQLPLALPPLASGILLLFLLGYASPLGALTGGRLTDSFAGIVLAEAFVAAPFLIVAARSAFAGVDPVLEEVAATLGHLPAAVFRRVSMPLAWRVIAAGMLLTWLRAFGEFGATVMLAYHPYSLPVYTYVAFGSLGLPAMLPILVPTLLGAVAVMALNELVLAGQKRRTGAEAVSALAPAAPAAPAAAGEGQPLAFAFRRSLPDFTLDVAWHTRARRLAILGASGSGKSATLRLIAGLDQGENAALTLGGEDLAARPAHARAIAYLPQDYGLLPHLRLAEQVRFARDADPLRAVFWTERLGLAGLEDRRPDALSLGQQQRVALARALARPGQLLLLDEPFSALDAPLRAHLRDELLLLQREIAATTILVTHDPAEAMELADELMLLDRGQVLRCGSVEAVYARPGSEAAARLLGARAVAAGVVIAPDRIALGEGVDLVVSGAPLSLGAVGWSVRPSRVRLVAAGGIPARLIAAEPARGGRRRVTLQLGAATVHATVDPGEGLSPGPCRVAIDPAAVQVWPEPSPSPAA